MDRRIASSDRTARTLAVGAFGLCGCLAVATAEWSCIPFATNHGARALPEGSGETTVTPSALAFLDDGGEDFAVPSLELEIRRGLTKDVDGALRFLVPCVYADVNWTFLQGGAGAVSVDPGVGLGIAPVSLEGGPTPYLPVWLPLLADLDLSSSATLTAGARAGTLVVPSDLSNVPAIGGGSLAVRLGKVGETRVSPEIAMLYSPDGDGSALVMVSFGIAVSFAR